MSSSKFMQEAKKIAKRDKAYFDSLIEFEVTKRMRSKTRMDFTIDRALADRFKKYCHKHGYIMSRKVEQCIQEILKD